MTQWLIAMTTGTWQVPGIQKAKALGYKVLGIDGDQHAEGLAMCDEQRVVDITNKTALLETLKGLDIQPAGVMSYCSEAGMFPAAWTREYFNLKGCKAHDVERLVLKHVQRKRWEGAGVEDLKWFAVETQKEALHALSVIGFPCIVKPVDGAGSRGVSKVLTRQEFDVAYETASRVSKCGLVMIEEYLDGTEYTVEGYSHQGHSKILLITEKKKVTGSRGVAASELMYPTVSASIQDRISDKVLAAIQALDYENGPSHTEVILTQSGRVGLVEMAGRGAGYGVFSTLIPDVSGVDATELLIKQTMGMPVDFDTLNALKHKFVFRFFPVMTPGIIVNVAGIHEANAMPGVKAKSFVKCGDSVDNDFVDGNRLGSLLVVGDDLTALHSRINQVESTVRFDIQQTQRAH